MFESWIITLFGCHHPCKPINGFGTENGPEDGIACIQSSYAVLHGIVPPNGDVLSGTIDGGVLNVTSGNSQL
jgi:hypothetical protein